VPGSPDRRCFGAIVVGAGPAGLALAARLGRRMEVALVERRSVGWAKPCAGLLCEEAYRELTALGLDGGYFEEPAGLELEVIALGRALPPQAFRNVDRKALGHRMRALLPPSVSLFEGRACRLGRRGEAFTASLRALGGETLPGSELELEAPRLVAADGLGSSTRRFLGFERVSILGLAQSLFPGKQDKAVMVIDPGICEQYYYWLVPKAAGFILGSAAEAGVARRSLEDAMRRFPGAFAEGDAPLRTERCAISKPAGAREIALYRQGGFLVGEAAGLVRPNSGEGLSSAFVSSRVLAEVIEARPGGVEEEGRAYEEAMRERAEGIIEN
jgi:flavin-dependent dehydrogenase